MNPPPVGAMVDPTTASGGADPLLIVAIVVGLWGLLTWICSQPPR